MRKKNYSNKKISCQKNPQITLQLLKKQKPKLIAKTLFTPF